MKDSEMRSKRVVIDETMNHFSPFGFHGMLFAKLILGNILVVKIADLPHQI